MKSILDSSFRYTPSSKTDLKKTFARIRRMPREIKATQVEADNEAESQVFRIIRKIPLATTKAQPS